MYSVKISIQRYAMLALIACTMVACGGAADDLAPSSTDQRPAVVAGSIGSMPSQKAGDFTVLDENGAPWRLYDHLSGGAQPSDAVVIYFTMWCPICLSHSDHLLYTVMPQFAGRGNTSYVLVDYVSGSVVGTRASVLANGYGGSPFTVLADSNLTVFNQFQASMGKTIVLDTYGTVLMNEDYRTGSNLISKLHALLP